MDIACLLGYSKASVTKALAGLSAAGLAEVVARDVRLTPEAVSYTHLDVYKRQGRVLCFPSDLLSPRFNAAFPDSSLSFRIGSRFCFREDWNSAYSSIIAKS